MDHEVKTFMFEDDGQIPNNPNFPLLLYPGAFLERLADHVQILNANNWTGVWKGTVFDYHHFHSNTHEVLVAESGKAIIKFGGENGKELKIAAGDVALIPAGVGHKKVVEEDDFQVVGAYPGGKQHDLLKGAPEERETALRNIRQVPVPEFDPVFAESGPMHQLWTGF